MTTLVWILVFMFNGQPMASGPHELEVCLYMAQEQTRSTGYRAHCYNVAFEYRREYPDMSKEYLK